MDSFVARQPILDRSLRVFGYEILYRPTAVSEEASVSDGDSASLNVIQSIVLVIGCDRLTGGRKAFINFTRNLLLQDAAFYLPKELAVIEILEHVKVDPELMAACQRLKHAGYLIALDDFVLGHSEHHPIAQLADIVKVDFRLTTTEERRTIVSRFGNGSRRFLAEKTETREEFQEALHAGYSLFQGYFFSKPTIIARKDIPVSKFNSLRMMRELHREDFPIEAIENVIRQDPSLVYKLLRYINSAFFGLRHKVTSIRHALALLGEKEVRKWATLTIYARVSKGQPEEVLRLSLLRAAFFESLAPYLNMAEEKPQLFLMGIFSLVDVLLGRPLEEALSEVPLSDDINHALLGGSNRYRPVFDLGTAYEKADWTRVFALCQKLSIHPQTVARLYLEAIEWTERIFLV